MADAPFHRTEFPDQGARLDTRDFDVRSEAGAREALARVNRLGTPDEKTAVREAVAKFWPNIGRGTDPRDRFPNSNMNP